MTTYDQFKGQSRLPKFAVPKSYDIKLKPDLVTCKFSGLVSILVHVVSATNFLVFNAADLNIDTKSISFKPSSFGEVLEPKSLCSRVHDVICPKFHTPGPSKTYPEELHPVGFALLEEDEIMVLEFAEELQIGHGVLSVSFEGTLNDQMRGFYRSVYEINGEKKNMAVTQFEPADARRCFPCWDEPAFKLIRLPEKTQVYTYWRKSLSDIAPFPSNVAISVQATFKITLDVPSDLIALSNMPVIKEVRQGDLKTLHFKESPIMSTYLVAIVVGLFEFVESHTSDGVKVRCYSQVGKASQGNFALGVAVKTLELYKKYFETPYPLPKLDMIAIPDFAAGAMENFGLVTYRESSLLYDDLQSSARNKQNIAVSVTHELGHQWFGNLVTMEWWSHLWLNEGFATWVSYLATDVLFPEWNVWTQFLEETANGLKLDALSGSHPIEVEINHASEIDEIFDDISYSKGASIVRMLQSYLGAERFQRALAMYIKRYAFSNAKTEDLWAVLEEISGEPVKSLMTTWTKQKGYPVVSAKLGEKMLEIEQSHFQLTGSPDDSLWMIPVTLSSGSYDARQTYLLQSKSGSIEVQESAWIKVNVNQTGFYRVKYDDNLAAKLQSAIKSNLLSATDRFGILDDSNALCMDVELLLSSLLTLIDSFREELDQTVLSKLITISSQVIRIVADAAPQIEDTLKQFFIIIYQGPAGKLGWDPKPGESDLDAMLRGQLLEVLVRFGHETTIDEAIRRFDAFLADRDSPLLPPDTRKAAYVALMQRVSSSDKSGFESLLRVYRESDVSQEKTRILASLASCPDPDVVLEVLNFLLTPEVRNQDAVSGLAVSIEGRETAWKWLKDNWNQISTIWSSGYLLMDFVSAIVSPFSSNDMVKEVEEFFASRAKPSIAMTLKQSIERIQINAKWVEGIRKDHHLAEKVQELAAK